MADAMQIKIHMQVIGSDGQHIGAVDKVEGDKIILTKSDPNSGGKHHAIPLDLVSTIDQKAVLLKIPAQQTRQEWQLWENEEENTHNQADGTASGHGIWP